MLNHWWGFAIWWIVCFFVIYVAHKISEAGEKADEYEKRMDEQPNNERKTSVEIKNLKAIQGKKLLVICPTRERVKLVKQFIKSFEETASRDTGLLFWVDADDPELEHYLFHLKPFAYIVGTERKTTTQMHNEILKALPDYKFYMQSNDDFVFKTKHWDYVLMGLIEERGGWGIAYGNDTIQGPNIPTTSVISGNIVRALGWLQMPTLTHLFGDNVWGAIGKGLGRIYYNPNVVIEHRHFAGQKAEVDSIYRRTNSKEMYQKDGAAFNVWMKTKVRQEVGEIVRAIHKEAGFKKKVSLCMIVGDFERPEVLKRCLKSVEGWVDEINLVINYKRFPMPWRFKRLKEIAFDGTHVVGFQYLKWTNFSDMRNQSLKMATGEYVFWLDADDYVDNPWAIKDTIFRDAEADYFGCAVHSYTEIKTKEVLHHNRLFKNWKGYEFRNSVHEDISFSMKEKGAVKCESSLVIHHLGNQSFKDVKRKNRRNLALALKDLNNNPHSLTYFAVVNCLMIEGGRENYIKALKTVDACFEKFPPSDEDPLTPKMWVLRGLCCYNCGQKDAARQSWNTAYAIRQNPEAAINLSRLSEEEKEWTKAIDLLEPIYQNGFSVGYNIPFDVVEMKRIILRRLGDCWGHVAEDLSRQEKPDASQVNAALQQAEKYYREFLAEVHDLMVADRLCNILRSTGRVNEADMLTVQLINKFPSYWGGWFNLGQTELFNQRYQTAAAFFREALRINPKYQEARHNLEQLKKARYVKA